MREAVIVSYARTGLAKAARGGFNNTSNMAMLGHAVKHAVARSKADPADVEDVVAGCVAASGNVARGAALLAGLPITTSGVTVHRACSSGLNAIANAARYVIDDGAQIVVGAGVDSITFQGGGGGGKEPKIVRDVSGLLDADDRHCRRGRRALQHLPRISGPVLARIPAPHGRGAAGRQVQGRDRPDGDADEGRQQGDEGRVLRRLRREQGRMQSPRHHARRPRQARAGEGSRQVHHRRQRLAALRRRGGRRHHGSEGSREARAAADGRVPRLGRRRLQAGRDGHRACVRGAAPARTSRPEGPGHRSLGTERSLRIAMSLFAATSSASILRSTTSMAAPSPSAIPSA